MRRLKLAGIVLAVVVGVIVLGATAVLLLVDPNDYRADIERLTAQRTGRSLQIGGRMSLRLFPWLAISISDVQLGNPPDYGSEPFLRIRRASVGVRLLPLLRRRLEVSRIAVDGLSATLVSRAAGNNNWKDLTGANSRTSPGGAPGESNALQATIAGLEVSNAQLVYRDEARGTAYVLSDLEAHLGALGGAGSARAAVQFDFADQAPEPAAHVAPLAHVALSTRAQVSADSSVVTLTDAQVQGQWFADAQKSGRSIPFSVRSPSLVLNSRTGTLAPATLDLQLGELTTRLTITAERLYGDRVLSGALSVPQQSLRRGLGSLGVELPASRDSGALSAFSFSSSYRMTARDLHLSALELTLDGSHARGSASIEDFGSMAVAYELSVDQLNVDRYRQESSRSAPRSAKASAATEQAPVRLPTETLRKLDVAGTLRIATATISGIPMSEVSLPLAARDGHVHLGPVQARMLGGSFDGDFVLDARAAQAHLNMNAHAKNADVGTLMRAAFGTTRVAGRGDANAVIAGVGNTDQDIFRSLAGKVDVNVKQGSINGIDLAYELQRAQALIRRETPPVRSGSARTIFNTFSGSGNLSAGVLHNDDLRVETDYLRAAGRGTLDLTTKAIDYSVLARLYRPLPQAAGAQSQTPGVAEIPLTITGSLDDMKVRPDVEALARSALGQKLQQKSDELKKKLGEKLQQLFGH
jgi:AsmA protein